MNLYFALLFFAISLLCYIFPSVDIAFTKLFYEEGIGFTYAQNLVVKFIFRAVPIITILYVIVLAIWTIDLCVRKDRKVQKIFLHLTLLFSLAIGSGVIVNLALKDNFGRARPKQIIEFGAKKEFSRVYEISNQCTKNCSFSSGHAAAAYSLTTIAFLVSPSMQLPVYLIGIAYGSIVGLGRVLQGGHFLSDVMTSAWIVLIINYIVFAMYNYFLKFYEKSQSCE